MNASQRLIDNRPSSYPLRPQAIGNLLASAREFGWAEPHLSTRIGSNLDELASALDAWPYPHDMPPPPPKLAVVRHA